MWLKSTFTEANGSLNTRFSWAMKSNSMGFMENLCPMKVSSHSFKGHAILCDKFSCNISNTRSSVSSGYPNTEKRVKKYDAQRGIFDNIQYVWIADRTLPWVFDYLLNQNKNKRVNERVKSSTSMLIKTGYPNILYACDFLCFNVMNY